MAELRTNIPDQHEGETSANFVYPAAEATTWNPYASGALALEIAAAMEAALPADVQSQTDPSSQPNPETFGRHRVETRSDIVTPVEIVAEPLDPLIELGKLGTTIAELRQVRRDDFELAA